MGISSVTAQQESDSGSPHPEPRKTTVAKLFSTLKPRRGKEISSYARSRPTRDSFSGNESSEVVSKGGSDPKAEERSLESYYVPIATYEGRHRYDPKATWSQAEETSLIRKLGTSTRLFQRVVFTTWRMIRKKIIEM